MKEEIVCVLDKSGSMIKCGDEAAIGLKTFVQDQLKIGDANLTIAFFDNKWNIHYEGQLSNYVCPIRWPQGGMTALYDAIGKTINYVGRKFSRTVPNKVILVILTDGLENASHEYTSADIAKMISHHKSKYGWEVIFLAADQDAWATGQKLNINYDQTFSYDSVDTLRGFRIMGQTVASNRVK